MDTNPQAPSLTLGRVQVAAAAVLASSVIYLVIGLAVKSLVQRPEPSHGLAVLSWALPAIGLLAGLASLWLHPRLVSARAVRATGGNTLAALLRGTLICWVLAEAPSILGLVRFLIVGGGALFAVMVGFSITIMLMTFPSRARHDALCAGLESLADEPQAGDQQ